MKTVLIATVALVIGLALGIALCVPTIRYLRRRVKELRAGLAGQRLQKPETMKRVIWICLFNGFAWVWCSYVLAALDKVQIAESLSQVAVTEIIGVVLAYAIKSAVENLSKNNRWPDKGSESENAHENQEPPEDGAAG